MVTEDQTAVIDFLASAETHGGAVERVDTHASIVFLAGTHVWKLKRAVRYDYLDYSTSERRRQMCEAEVRVSRRSAPALYRGVVAVTRERDGSLALGGRGEPVDWVVEMARFDQAALLDRLAERGSLELDLMRPLANAIASLHRNAERRTDHGGRAGMAWVVDGNASAFALEGSGILDSALAARVTHAAQRALGRHAGQLDARRRAGFVRQCHGDLHLRNIVLIDGQPAPFDAIEFNDEIACVDVLYDLAFLLMDLWRRRLPRHANAVWNGYVTETGGVKGASLLPLFLSCRAAVRAKTSATAAGLEPDAARRARLGDLAGQYLDLAGELLEPPGPSLVAVGGLSGSGKSTLALALGPSIGPVPGALVVRSDEVRKRIHGVPPLTRLGTEAYTSDVSRRVYDTIADQARAALGQEHAVIVDGVFAEPSNRAAIEQVAAAAGVPFVGLWLHAPGAVLHERVVTRAPDASDADEAVVDAQLHRGAGIVGWCPLDAARPPAAVFQEATQILAARLGSAVQQDT